MLCPSCLFQSHECQVYVVVPGVGNMVCECTQNACRQARAERILRRYGK